MDCGDPLGMRRIRGVLQSSRRGRSAVRSGTTSRGGNMPLPTLTPEQRQQALEKAAEARRKRAELKAQLKSSSVSLSSVLNKEDNDTVGKMKVASVLENLPGVGKVRVGKSAIVARLLNALPELELSISATTRSPRAIEDEGRHYYFVEPEVFSKMVEEGGFLEWAEIFGQRYGTPREPVERALAAGRDVLVEIDVQGARQVRRAKPDAFMLFLKPPSLGELERRLRSRATETDEQIRRRLAKATEELAAEPEFDASVVNDDLETAAREVIEIVTKVRDRG